MDHRPILVIGGTGHYGRMIVRRLHQTGETGSRVRVMSRNAREARKVVGGDVEIVEGDLMSRSSISEAVKGAGSMIISVSALNFKLARLLRAVERDAVLVALEEARKAGVTRVVYLSGYELRPALIEELKFELGRIKLEVEAAVSQSDFNWTILGAGFSMEIFFAMLRGKQMMVPGGGPPGLPAISPVDVGEIASQTVHRQDLGGKRIRMTGPEALSFPEAARRISAVLGRPIRYRSIPVLPLKIAAVLSRPFNPFFRHLVASVKLMNGFPQDLVASVPEDHQRLRDTFDYVPVTLEMEVRRRR